jgi:hypothetical protein
MIKHAAFEVTLYMNVMPAICFPKATSCGGGHAQSHRIAGAELTAGRAASRGAFG